MTEREAFHAPIVFVVALDCEAKPLISHFNLSRCHDIHAYRVFCSGSHWLIVSGVGKAACANAVGFMAGLLHHTMLEFSVWINVGIAQHAELPLGTCCWVSRAEDRALKRALFPVSTVSLPCQVVPCITVDETWTVNHENDQVDEQVLHDREASAFVFSASRVSTLEWIHAFKVVSDNRDNPPDKIKTSQVRKWITSVLEPVGILIDHLQRMREPLIAFRSREDGLFNRLVGLHPYSESRRHQLRRLCRRLVAFKKEQALDWKQLEMMADSRSAIALLEGLVESLPSGP